MRLILIRHGDPDYVNDSLTEKGFREAGLLAGRVKDWDVEAFYVSPLGRAKATAKASLELAGREAVTCDWLSEFHAPVLDPELGRKIPWDLMPGEWTKEEKYYQRGEWFNTPLMRTGDVEKEYRKVCRGLDELLKSYGYEREGNYYRVVKGHEGTIVCFCHMGISLLILSHLLGMTPVQLWHGFFLAPASVTVLATEERKEGVAYFRCQVAGDTSHLTGNGESVSASGYFTEPFQG